MRTTARIAADLMAERVKTADLRRLLEVRDLEVASLKRINRRIWSMQKDALPVQRKYCDNCIHWEFQTAKCLLGYTRRFFFKVPTEYNQDEKTYGWFRRPNCREYAECAK